MLWYAKTTTLTLEFKPLGLSLAFLNPGLEGSQSWDAGPPVVLQSKPVFWHLNPAMTLQPGVWTQRRWKLGASSWCTLTLIIIHSTALLWLLQYSVWCRAAIHPHMGTASPSGNLGTACCQSRDLVPKALRETTPTPAFHCHYLNALRGTLLPSFHLGFSPQ